MGNMLMEDCITIFLDGEYVQTSPEEMPPEVMEWAKAQIIAKKLEGKASASGFHGTTGVTGAIGPSGATGFSGSIPPIPVVRKRSWYKPW